MACLPTLTQYLRCPRYLRSPATLCFTTTANGRLPRARPRSRHWYASCATWSTSLRDDEASDRIRDAGLAGERGHVTAVAASAKDAATMLAFGLCEGSDSCARCDIDASLRALRVTDCRNFVLRSVVCPLFVRKLCCTRCSLLPPDSIVFAASLGVIL
jgi:hypothetical protein